MSIAELAWDSAFFKMKIGSLSLSAKDQIKNLAGKLAEARERGFKLVYVFTPYPFPKSSKILSEFRSRKVDEKVIYQMRIHPSKIDKKKPLVRIVRYKAKNAGKALTALAIQSGVHSRFKFDPGFRSEEYRRLYTLWIQRSVRREISDETFVSLDGSSSRITGFVTLKIKNRSAFIDLIGVDASCRGKGIGTSLVLRAQAWSCSKKANVLSVATQRDNKAACGLYEKMGFEEFSSSFVYHIWL